MLVELAGIPEEPFESHLIATVGFALEVATVGKRVDFANLVVYPVVPIVVVDLADLANSSCPGSDSIALDSSSSSTALGSDLAVGVAANLGSLDSSENS